MTEVLLIPPIINPIFEDKNFMPLGLLAIAASLSQHGFSAKLYHPEKGFIKFADFNSVSKKILLKKPRVVAFSTWCISYPASLLVAREIKQKSPETAVLFGGPQASIVARETLHYFPFVDFVLSGEADFSFPQFLTEFFSKNPEYSQIPGLTCRGENGEILQNPNHRVIENLDQLPVPSYELIHGNKSLKLDVGRGCPFKCTYCTTNNFFSKKYRVKSVKRILHEMEFAAGTFKIKKFSFAHDMFTLNKNLVYELCTALIRKKDETGINYTWTCSARTDCVNRKMLLLMKQAGCEAIFFGIESGSEKMQTSINKNLKIAKVLEVANICRETGLNMHASFIMGFPDETKTDLEKSLRCAFQLATNGVLVQFSELSLLPGTPIFEEHHSSLKFDGLFSNFSNIFCSRDEIALIRQFPKIFSSFYYLPVKTLQHPKMSFLSHIINSLSKFRNTLYLLGNLLLQDIEEKKMLELYRKWYNLQRKEELANTPAVSHITRFLRNYILKNKNRINNPAMIDIFTFEAFQGLLLARFNRWQLIKQQSQPKKNTDHSKIKPTLAWTILNTKYKLNKVLPSENNWNTGKTKTRKGKYSYLIIAYSPERCKMYRVNKTDEYLLGNLSEKSIDDFIKDVGSEFTKQKILEWLKKMKKLGVVEFE